MRVVDKTAAFNAKMRAFVMRNLERVARAYVNDVKIALNARPGQTGKAKAARKYGELTTNRSVSVRRGTTGRVLGFMVRSRPGEMPRKQTGELIRSHTLDIMPAQLQVRAGPSVRYAAPLELGAPAKHLLARPFLYPVLQKNAAKYGVIVTTGSLK